MKSIFTRVPYVLLVFLVFLITYRVLFLPKLFFGGDYYFPPFPQYENTLEEDISLWTNQTNSGLGGSSLPVLGTDIYTRYLVSVLVKSGFSALAVQKTLFLLPLIILMYLGSSCLLKLLIKSKIYRILGILVYSTNAYIQLVVKGGQFGIAFAYFLLPLCLYYFLKIMLPANKRKLDSPKLSDVLGLALTQAAVIFSDIRYFFILAVFYFIYFMVWLIAVKFNLVKLSYKRLLLFLFTGIFTIGLLSFWFIPLSVFGSGIISRDLTEYTALGALKYFSFADFSNTISLLHPNWPENIFGKTYFMRPEFLIIPVIAYLSFYYLGKKKTFYESLGSLYPVSLLYFSLLALVGAYLSKGVNDPFGIMNSWFYVNIPGMSLFRDPTKFYVLIASGYAVMIPTTLSLVSEQLIHFRNIKSVSNKHVRLLPALLFFCFWVFALRAGFSLETTSGLRPMSVPEDYVQLGAVLDKDQGISGVMWLPDLSPFNYSSKMHNSVSAKSLLSAPSHEYLLKFFSAGNLEHIKRYLDAWNIGYLVIPDDKFGNIFAEGRKYDSRFRNKYISAVTDIFPGLGFVEIPGFEDIAVWKRTVIPGLVSTDGQNNGKITVRLISPGISFILPSEQDNLLRIAYKYDQNWRLINDRGHEYQLEKTDQNTVAVSDVMPAGRYEYVYLPQLLYMKVRWISLVFVLISITSYLYLLFLRTNVHAKKHHS